MKTIIEALTAHHDEIRQLISETKTNKQKLIWLKKHLEIHHELEEDLLFKPLNGMEQFREESLESQEEHRVFFALMNELASLNGSNFRWKVKFRVLEEIIEKHLLEEELVLFPRIEMKLTRRTLNWLGEQFTSMKQEHLELEEGRIAV